MILRQTNLNEMLINMVVQDFQPFSIVNDIGFKAFVEGLDPSYQLPSRMTLSKILLPNLYYKLLGEIKEEISHGETFTLTIDGWTSPSNESYFAYTVHYIDEEFQMKTFLLECKKFNGRHTTENINKDIERILEEWNLKGKINAIVSDSAANMKAAVKLSGLNHLNCFAHLLNLIVQSGLKSIHLLLIKVKLIVEYFGRSSYANEKLMNVQKQLNPNVMPIKLKNNVVTQWNSTYEMLSRILAIREPLEATIELLQKPVSSLDANEWKCLSDVLIILKPFNNITKNLSGEKYVTISKLLIIIQCLRSKTVDFLKSIKSPEVTHLLNVLIEEMNVRFNKCEENYLLARATCLDPRFKKMGFSSETAFNKIKETLIKEISVEKECIEIGKTSMENINLENEDIWSFFDEKVSKLISTSQTLVIMEMRNFLDESYLGRNECPLNWWNLRKHSYPRLSILARKALSVALTSVACERAFSKSGELLSEKRNRLLPKNLNMIMFLNVNSKKNK